MSKREPMTPYSFEMLCINNGLQTNEQRDPVFDAYAHLHARCLRLEKVVEAAEKLADKCTSDNLRGALSDFGVALASLKDGGE